jgi:hypothetical protein
MGGDRSKVTKVSRYNSEKDQGGTWGIPSAKWNPFLPTYSETVTDHVTVAQQFGSRDVFLKFESREKAEDARRYYRGRELFYGVKVKFEFGTEEGFRAIKDLQGEVSPDGTPLDVTPHLSQTHASESTPSTPTQTLESLIPKGQSFRTLNDGSGNFPKIRQRLPDGTYEGQTQCIFLGNVPFELLMDKRDIWKRFEVFGEIMDIRIREYCCLLLGRSFINE